MEDHRILQICCSADAELVAGTVGTRGKPDGAHDTYILA